MVIKMNYLVIGAGGTGACIAGFMQMAQKNISLIARGENLNAIKANGLTILRPNETINIKIKALSEQENTAKADVIFVCVKYYSLDEIYDLIKKASHQNTVVIPILNVYGTGEKMLEKLENLTVLNGCIYIASSIKDYGVIKQSGEIFRIVFGKTDGTTDDLRLKKIKEDLENSNIDVIFSENIKKDTMQKFAFVSCAAAVGAYLNANAGIFKKQGKERDMFIACINEIYNLSKTMGINLPENIVDINLKIMENLDDDFTTSMQKDLKKGNKSEVDGLVYEVVRLSEKYNSPCPTYKKIADYIRSKT